MKKAKNCGILKDNFSEVGVKIEAYELGEFIVYFTMLIK
jgi:hypothetical protein